MSDPYKIRNDFVVRSGGNDANAPKRRRTNTGLKTSFIAASTSLVVGFGAYTVFQNANTKTTLDHINDITRVSNPKAVLTSLAIKPAVEIQPKAKNGQSMLEELVEESSLVISHENLADQVGTVDSVHPISIQPPRPITLITDTTEQDAQLNANNLNENSVISVSVEKGDTLSSLFTAMGLSGRTAIQIAKIKDNKPLNRLKVGDTLTFKISSEHEFEELRLDLNPLDTLVISKVSDNEFETNTEKKEIEWRTRTISGEIKNSFSGAASAVGLNNGQVAELAGIYKWDMDFNLDVRRGDRFYVILEEGFVGETKVRGKTKILAAEYKGAIVGRLTAIRHEYPNGEISFYTPEGRGFQKAFLRAPLNYRRISSGFTPKRYHPILKKWRSHKGTDFAARRGEPVASTASGKIIHIGRKGAYGKTIIVKHQDGITTLYAHLNSYKKGLKRGARVRQGELIGYVGSTGLSTGPHLHYEFRKNNKQLDPMKVKLPRVTPIKGEELAKFNKNAQNLLPQIARLRGERETEVLAQN